MYNFRNKVVIVTGGSEGIGRALVEQLLEAGARVATCGRTYDKLYDLQMQYAGQPLHVMSCDVSRESECRQFIQSTIRTFGGIDVLINNAGISMRAEVREVEPEVMRRVMEVNFFGAMYCTRFALPAIMERKGVVVGISSVAGYRGLPGRSAYSASKAALQGWLEALRTELLDEGVHVMWVSPGFVASNIRYAALDESGGKREASTMDEQALMSAETCAGHILRGISRKKRALVLGFTGKQTVFLNKLFPSLTDRLVRKYYYKNGELVR